MPDPSFSFPFSGCATALVTPFRDGLIDYVALARLLDFQLDGGADALVVCATTGEASTLADEEKYSLIEFTCKYCSHAVPVVAGIGSNCTDHAASLARDAQKAGADALLAVNPYYIKANDEGLISHYTAIEEATDLPIILYNVPSRTGQNIPASVVAQLSRCDRIRGIKDAGSDIVYTERILRECRDGFAVYSGNDDRISPILSLGGAGAVSVVSNIVPKKIHDMCVCAFSGRDASCARTQLELLPLIDAIFSEVNPIGIKWALYKMGLICPEYRLPLCPPGEKTKQVIEDAIKEAF